MIKFYNFNNLKNGIQKIMQNLPKQLQTQIQVYLNSPNESHFIPILTSLQSRVDMPKHLILIISKQLQQKDNRLFLLILLLKQITQKYENKIALFNQINNKEFLFKLGSLTNMKNVQNNSKIAIVDLIYQWKQMFKNDKQLFNHFWNFYQTFNKKGLTPTDKSFQTVNQPQVITQVTKQQSDLLEIDIGNQQIKFQKIQKCALPIFSKVIQSINLTNQIITNTDPQMMDFPQILRDKLSQLKISQDQINKFIGQNRNQQTVKIALSLVRTIHITQRRYNDLMTRYLPVKFVMEKKLNSFLIYCRDNQLVYKENVQPFNNKLDLMDLNTTTQPSKNTNLIDIQTVLQPSNAKTQIASFFGNLINKASPQSLVQNSTKQITLQTLQSDFKTQFDFKKYNDPKPIIQHLTDLSDFKPTDLLPTYGKK